MLPTPHTIQVERWSANAASRDAHGNPAETYAAPEAVAVHWIGPAGSAEDALGGRRHAEAVLQIGAPAGTVIDYRDRVLIDGARWQVVGEPQDYSRGPWAMPFAGVTFELKRDRG